LRDLVLLVVVVEWLSAHLETQMQTGLSAVDGLVCTGVSDGADTAHCTSGDTNVDNLIRVEDASRLKGE
jgi:hypothetical protein